MTCDDYLTVRLAEIDSDDGSIRSRRGVGGGCINNAEVLELKSGARYFLKLNKSSFSGLFTGEAAGLKALGKAAALRVPAVAGFHDDGRQQLILLEYIPEGRKGPDFWEVFGRALAALHRYSSSRGFGFEADNHIGATEQPNGWNLSWFDFFAERRIGFQLDLARRNGRADRDLVREGERFCSRLADILIEPAASSLLHGDLWGGNYMVDEAGAPVLIDPAVYYGHREADLAMTELFGGFGSQFYGAYREAWPLEPGYEERRDAYNLYHMLNHLNLFGGSYLGAVRSILKQYA